FQAAGQDRSSAARGPGASAARSPAGAASGLEAVARRAGRGGPRRAAAASVSTAAVDVQKDGRAAVAGAELVDGPRTRRRSEARVFESRDPQAEARGSTRAGRDVRAGRRRLERPPRSKIR